jgi:acyl dehydratase
VAVDGGLAGRTFDPTPPYEVGRADVARFAAAVGEPVLVHVDVALARERGHRDVPAPPTFPIVVAFDALQRLLDDPSVGIELRNVVHAGQRFEYSRPVYAGDVLTAALTVESVREAAGTDLIANRIEITDADGAHVCTARATLAHRAPEAAS